MSTAPTEPESEEAAPSIVPLPDVRTAALVVLAVLALVYTLHVGKAFFLPVVLAVTLVFLTLEITEILLVIGFFRLANGGSDYWLHAGGWAGIVTALVAWYASAAGVVNGMSPRAVLPVGRPMWGELPAVAQAKSPTPRREPA